MTVAAMQCRQHTVPPLVLELLRAALLAALAGMVVGGTVFFLLEYRQPSIIVERENITEQIVPVTRVVRVDQGLEHQPRRQEEAEAGAVDGHLLKVTDDVKSKGRMQDLLRFPGTEWCGHGWRADRVTRLGSSSATDRCCRQHDLGCPDTVPSGGVAGVQTMSHCSCDRRFRACLTAAHSNTADTIGRIFFNVFQSPCFEWRPAECGAWPARLRPWLGCRAVKQKPRLYTPTRSSQTKYRSKQIGQP